MEDNLFSAIEIGIMLQLINDIEDEQKMLISNHEIINAKILKLVKLQDKSFDKEKSADVDAFVKKNNDEIDRLKSQLKSIVKYKKLLHEVINKRIDAKISDDDRNLEYKAFLYG